MKTKANKTKKVLYICAAVVVCALTIAWLAQVSRGTQSDLESLRGGLNLPCCENCQNRYSHFYECYHGTMSPEVLCRTDACIENKHWYIECSATTGGAPGDCDYHKDYTKMYRWQERKYALCSHGGENPFYRQTSHPCAPSKVEYVRCITTGCDGVGWGTSPKYGREVCGL